jgi:hypothetical protein
MHINIVLTSKVFLMILSKQNMVIIRLTLTSKIMNETIERTRWLTRLYPMTEPEAPESNMVLCCCNRADRCSVERMP